MDPLICGKDDSDNSDDNSGSRGSGVPCDNDVLPVGEEIH